MTREAFERDQLDQERSPLLKRRLRLSRLRNRQPSMLSAVEASSLVIASPAGAVALSYKPGVGQVPVVLIGCHGERGALLVARARAHGARLAFDHDLVCALLSLSPGDPLPKPHWRPVAKLMRIANAHPLR